ncbi:unnamed protein product [Didymodactylos carnosus]|uniref:Large ribosomal subunit protein mL62 n=1 Tax=Didymodactylos carnosus TaxID=1234261 RepID=A0A814F8J7_9BILA|nr:unnamed protein product [Didymodactylos carnosus]CAF0981683.1 unnamed protein product [Didymodactylos carnosus]CAF3749686.1 unnamed protein product [Didymodactylos carnosus]CAF3754209.1 unnamed protein product [Didymodactylos carnosus]
MNILFLYCTKVPLRYIINPCRSYKSALAYEKLFPKSSSLNILTEDNVQVKSPTKESDEQFNGFIPIDKIEINHRHSRGPGGQHVNKNLTGVEVRFHLDTATWIPNWIKPRIKDLYGNRINKDGYFITFSDETRHQLLNQAHCFDRIRAIIRDSSILPKGLTKDEQAMIEKRYEKSTHGISENGEKINIFVYHYRKNIASEERVLRKRFHSQSKHDRTPDLS